MPEEFAKGSGQAPLSPRRKRLRLTAWAVAAVCVATSAVALFLYWRSRPAPYRPDEQAAEITQGLVRQLPPRAPKPVFTDVNLEAGLGAFRNFQGERTSQLPEDMGPGLAWGDFNNDGLDDLFLVSAGGALNVSAEKLLPCELYQNLGGGKFRKVPGFPETRIHGMAAAWGDFDGDGFLDLIVTGYNALLLFHNEGGSGKFALDPRIPNLKGFWSSASWGDYDNDRKLDLYICGYVQFVESPADVGRASDQAGTTVPYTLNPASFLGGTNLLFHNIGNGEFEEIGAQLKVQNPEGRSLGGLWHDFDEDGWDDLYVANDISDNVCYHNTHGKFEDISHPALVADYRSAMGLAAGDFDRDGDDDLFITHWVAQENALYENLWADLNSRKDGASTNKHPLRFMDIADQKGLGQIALPYVGWGVAFADLDQDGWLDLIMANGNTLEEEGPLPKKLKPQEPFFFWNEEGRFFHNLSPLSAVLSQKHNSRGLALADYDGDGDLDVAIAQLGEGVQLLRNDLRTGHWLQVRLRSLDANGQPLGFADGTKVVAHLANAALRRCVSSVSYLSQNSRTLHFGLGAEDRVEKLEVRWHAGGTNVFANLAGDSLYEITEGNPSPKKIGKAAPSAASASSANAEKQRLLEFWARQREAFDLMKVRKEPAKAIPIFEQALALNPSHEDSLYYLGLCLAGEGRSEEALAQWAKLKEVNSQSHRAFQQWGILRATTARNAGELAAAETSLERAHALNPEETGALLALGEVSILRGDLRTAESRLAAACRTNPKAVSGFFMRGYLAWKEGKQDGARAFLEQTRTARGPDWQPKGSTSEGDVKEKHHVESTPLARFWEGWNGGMELNSAFEPLDKFLRSQQ